MAAASDGRSTDMRTPISSRALRSRKWIAADIARLDPDTDSAQIMCLIINQLLPRRGGGVLLNVLYTVGFMHIAGQREGARAVDRHGTGKIHRDGDRRANDTLSFFLGWFQHGPRSPDGNASLAQIKRIHDHYARDYSMSNETFIHTIALFTVQFEQLFSLVGAEGFTQTEKAAQVTHWRGVGDGLGVRELPTRWADMERFRQWYEASPDRFGPTPEATRCVNALIDQFSDRWLPTRLRWAGRPLLLSLHNDHTLRAIGQTKPHSPVVWLVRHLVRAGLFVNRRVLSDRRELVDLSTLFAHRDRPM